jgi:predicted peptidase
MTALIFGVLVLYAGAVPEDEVAARFEERTFMVPDSAPPLAVRYRLLKPALVEPGKTYPVVLFLHGAGERGDDNRRQLVYLPEWMTRKEWRDRYACYLIAPQCHAAESWMRPKRADDETAKSRPQAGDTEVVLGILRAVTAAEPVDRRRVYLTGLSMGGYGSWSLAAQHPELFAAVVPICGGGDPAWATKLKDVPIWAVHGGADTTVPPQNSRKMIDAIKAAGGSPRYTELEGVGHNSWTPAYDDPQGVLPWMFQQHQER